MTVVKALAYFVREAGSSLVRSWRVSLLAVLTIAVSLLVGGVFLVAGGNLARVVERARDESRVVVYMEPGTPAARARELAGALGADPRVADARAVTADEARERFVEIFPSLADLVEEGDGALPPSVELEVRPGAAAGAGRDPWLEELRATPGVTMVDDDRDWVAQLSAVVAVVRGLGLALGGVLLGAAVFTIGSVIRLTAYLYEEEMTIMRLVGATEFFIRGPFYAEGLLQGLLGGLLAAGGLSAAAWGARERLGDSLLGRLVAAEPPAPGQLLLLVGLGAAAGLLGATLSLRRESLGEQPLDEA
ncbi:MAG TPA: permease-like cell division protein FtsX [Thermoanaerobaculia bacterium]|nr:permease-like cell division protein FtsX [Thermoanaerobaculia bacterium]